VLRLCCQLSTVGGAKEFESKGPLRGHTRDGAALPIVAAFLIWLTWPE
jgi:hypothetical protein